jgi:hypothetical protein
MKRLLIVAIAALTGVAFGAAADRTPTAAIDTHDLPTFYIETASRSVAQESPTLDTLVFYTPMVARVDAPIVEAFYTPMVMDRSAHVAQPSLDLLVFYTPMVMRPIVAFDAGIDTLVFYTPMVIPTATLDVQASIDTLAFYTPMVARPSVVEFDVQTSFDVPVPYERRADSNTAEAT